MAVLARVLLYEIFCLRPDVWSFTQQNTYVLFLSFSAPLSSGIKGVGKHLQIRAWGKWFLQYQAFWELKCSAWRLRGNGRLLIVFMYCTVELQGMRNQALKEGLNVYDGYVPNRLSCLADEVDSVNWEIKMKNAKVTKPHAYAVVGTLKRSCVNRNSKQSISMIPRSDNGRCRKMGERRIHCLGVRTIVEERPMSFCDTWDGSIWTNYLLIMQQVL